MRTEQLRQVTARERVLARLQQGPATNVDLNAICFRYGARLFELKRQGHRIVRTSKKPGVFTYTLEVA